MTINEKKCRELFNNVTEISTQMPHPFRTEHEAMHLNNYEWFKRGYHARHDAAGLDLAGDGLKANVATQGGEKKALAEQIKQVMELDAKRTRGQWRTKPPQDASRVYGPFGIDCVANVQVSNMDNWKDNAEFIASAPLMASIIRQLVDIVTQQHEALRRYVNVVVSVNDPNDWSPKVADGGLEARKALALSAPIVNMKKGG